MNDTMLLVGCMAVVGGVWRLSEPVAMIVAGVLLAGAAIVRHVNQGRNRGPT